MDWCCAFGSASKMSGSWSAGAGSMDGLACGRSAQHAVGQSFQACVSASRTMLPLRPPSPGLKGPRIDGDDNERTHLANSGSQKLQASHEHPTSSLASSTPNLAHRGLRKASPLVLTRTLHNCEPLVALLDVLTILLCPGTYCTPSSQPLGTRIHRNPSSP